MLAPGQPCFQNGMLACGAVVGSQPFGGEGLSGTGPKAGGPLYLSRFATTASAPKASDAQARTKCAGINLGALSWRRVRVVRNSLMNVSFMRLEFARHRCPSVAGFLFSVPR